MNPKADPLRQALAEIEQMPASMVNDSESLRHTIKSMQSIASAALSTPPVAPGEHCILCANGNDLPDGEYCRGCGRNGNATGLRAAVLKARGRQEPPSSPVTFAAETIPHASYECAARKQGTPGGMDPADCDWPGCGCDPAANKVLEAIDEAGFEIVPRSTPPVVAGVDRAAVIEGDDSDV